MTAAPMMGRPVDVPAPSYRTTITAGQAERLARVVRMCAGVKPGQRLSMLTIAKRICHVTVMDMKTSRGCIFPYERAKGGWIIAIQRRDPDREEILAHELGHWAMQAILGRVKATHTEGDADAVASALLGRKVDSRLERHPKGAA